MDYIPIPDSAFDTWLANYLTYLNANVVALGLTALDTDVTALNSAQTDWQTKYPAHITAQGAAATARQAKDASRNTFVTIFRRLTQRLQTSSSVSDAERAALGITIPDRDPTPVGPPSTRPVLQADTSQRQQIGIAFVDEGTPTSKAKPAGVSGCEIWVKLGGAPPADLSECDYLATDTRTPYVASFDGAQANQTAHFIGRWISTRNEPGPLSETLSATVPA
jgi:hypothetical protein